MKYCAYMLTFNCWLDDCVAVPTGGPQAGNVQNANMLLNMLRGSVRPAQPMNPMAAMAAAQQQQQQQQLQRLQLQQLQVIDDIVCLTTCFLIAKKKAISTNITSLGLAYDSFLFSRITYSEESFIMFEMDLLAL